MKTINIKAVKKQKKNYSKNNTKKLLLYILETCLGTQRASKGHVHKIP